MVADNLTPQSASSASHGICATFSFLYARDLQRPGQCIDQSRCLIQDAVMLCFYMKRESRRPLSLNFEHKIAKLLVKRRRFDLSA